MNPQQISPSPARTGARSFYLLQEMRARWLLGVPLAEIADRMGRREQTLRDWVCLYELDAPPAPGETERLLLWVEYRRICQLVENDHLPAEARCKLVTAQVKLFQALERATNPADPKESDMPKSPRAQAEFDRIEALSDEEMDHEIRVLAGLESKQSEPAGLREAESGADETPDTQPVHPDRSSGPEAA